jgi:D-glycero-D-manno-heptose 1,7-bisphosphate phosphatase
MDRVIFLDRDGTINEEVEYLHRPEDLRLLPGVGEAIRRLREYGFAVVVVTNQAGVARGYYEEEDVTVLHDFMNKQLKEQGACIDHFFYCPHHPVHGIGKYRVACHCRKPETGMFLMAEQFYQVDKANSYMIGDKLLDVEAGHNYGVKSVLVGTGYGAETVADMTEEEQKNAFEHYSPDLLSAADWIIGETTTKHP